MEDEVTRPSSPPQPPPPAASAASSVLADDDLLREILLRLGFPTCLVRASLVSRRWLRHASDSAFLRRFRARNPPRLLGFYHTARRDEQPAFVPLPQPPELAPVLRRGGFTLGGASGTNSAVVFDCRNGRLLRAEFPPPPEELRFGVVSPLLHPARQLPDLPPTLHSQLHQRGVQVPHDAFMLLPGWMLLPEDGGEDLSYTLVVLIRRGGELFARAVLVRGESNEIRTSGCIELPKHWPNKMNRGLLFHGNLYMLGKEHILGLNLASMSLFLIKLPDGVEQLEHMGNLELLRAGDSGLYLVRLKGFQIHIWHHVTDGSDGGDWELVDTMSLHQSFGQVVRPDWESGDPSLGDAFVSLRRVEDNAELFLIVDHMIFHINIANRTAYKVFEMTQKEDIGFEIFPFMMIWPPTFPALNYDDDHYE